MKLDFEDFEDLVDEDEFLEHPVDLDTFLTDKYYLGNADIRVISDTQRQIIEAISQIYKLPSLIKLYGEEEGQRIWDATYHEIVAMCGKGGGKDFSSRIGFIYTIYKLHCLRNPISYYNKALGTYIDLLNIAINADQARDVFFNPLKNILSSSPYFQEMGFEPRKSSLEFNSCPIRLFSGNSEAESWEGLDLLLVVLDEIAAFKTDAQFQKASAGGAQRLSASGIYDMSKNSVVSRFADIGKTILLSFPRFQGDFICQRYEETANDPTVLRIKAPTWVMNPFVTRESLEPQFKRNRVQAEMRFGCNPPEMIDAFFRDPMAVRSCFKADWEIVDKGTVDEKIVFHEIADLIPIKEDGTFKSWFKAETDHTRFIHVDLGLKRDRAALCMVHSPGTRKIEVEFGVFEELPVVKMDLIHYWEALPGKEIDFAAIREFIKLLARKFPVGLVTFDRWQSVDMQQILNKRGIPCDQHSVKKNDYDTLSTAFMDSRFTGYYHKELIENELLKLQTLDNGKVDHPDGFHDDLAQALASATWNCCEFADMDAEIEISVFGDEFSEHDLELLEAQEEERSHRDKRYGKEKSSMTYDEDEMDFELQTI